jgi:hypothetical protein
LLYNYEGAIIMTRIPKDFYEIAIENIDNLYTHALLLTSNMENAEIVVQKTFEKAFSIFKTDGISDYSVWFLGILQCVTEKERLAA